LKEVKMSLYTRTQVLTIITVITMSVLLVSPSQGRKHEATIDVSGGRGYVVMGTSMLDIDELNTSLSNAGYSELSDNFFTLGGGGHAIINRIIIGGEGHGLMADERQQREIIPSLSPADMVSSTLAISSFREEVSICTRSWGLAAEQ
jgi:hypothetical protein